MSILESLIYVLWRGLAIGIIISAPMGPVGILCIQRTLDKGRRTGFLTGVGAAISDLFYCLLTGFGLSLVEDFLEKNQNIIQLAGSIVLVVFGIYLFRKNPTTTMKRQVDIQEATPTKDILYGFLFTVSNPLIIFLIIGLFARFNFILPQLKFYHIALGYAAILAGALGWWWLVSFVINKIRNRFSIKSMLFINHLIGCIILIFALFGIGSSFISLFSQSANGMSPHKKEIYLNKARGFGELEEVKDGELKISGDFQNNSLEIPAASDFSLTWRASSSTEWGLRISNTDAQSIELNISPVSSGNFFDFSPHLDVSANYCTSAPSQGKNLFTKSVKENINTTGGENSWRLIKKGNNCSLFCGNRKFEMVGEWNLNDFIANNISFSCQKGDLNISSISYIYESSEEKDSLTEEELKQFCKKAYNSKKGLLGIWQQHDSDFDITKIQPVGNYTLLGLEPDEQPGLYFISCSEELPLWKPGDIKARLFATPTKGVYEVEWIDADGESIHHKGILQLESSDILSLQFPRENTSIRFIRTNQ